MSTQFLIAPYHPDVWRSTGFSYTEKIGSFELKPKVYYKALRERWQNVVFHSALGDVYALSWNLPPESPEYAGLEGRLALNQQVVIFGTGPKASFLDFIVWHRHQVSVDLDLYLLNTASSAILLLSPDTTQDDLIEFTGIVE
jgi:hypothetical protein